jgi:hypothetical protein
MSDDRDEIEHAGIAMQLRSLLLMALRALWAVVPLTSGAAFAALLDDRSPPVRTAAGVMLWVGWSIGLLAMLVPAPVALTVVRSVATAGAVVVVVGALADATAFATAAALATTAAAALALTPEVGVRFVNGGAYPNERRFLLRVPAPLLFGPLPLAWAAVIGGPATATLLLASRQWVAGAIATAVAVPVAAVLGRALHGLARRWIVFVPAGVVLHDPMTLTDPVLFPRPAIASFGPAGSDTTATDLTQRALGLPLELRAHEPAPVSLVHPGRRQTDNVTVTAILFTPTRPGAVLEEAARRQIARPATPPPSTTSPA